MQAQSLKFEELEGKRVVRMEWESFIEEFREKVHEKAQKEI